MQHLKIATNDDFDDLVRMACEFAKASPYGDLPIEVEKVQSSVANLLTSPTSIGILYVKDGKNVGVLAGTVNELPFSYDRVASEIVLWVDPNHRDRGSLKLVPAFEYWAKHKGKAKYVHLASLADERVNRYYTRIGYKKTEEAFLKDIS